MASAVINSELLSLANSFAAHSTTWEGETMSNMRKALASSMLSSTPKSSTVISFPKVC